MGKTYQDLLFFHSEQEQIFSENRNVKNVFRFPKKLIFNISCYTFSIPCYIKISLYWLY